jgi:hypothetical protein
MEKQKEIKNTGGYNQIVDAFKNSKKNFESKRKEMEEYINKNTSKEMEELDAAYQKYQKKIDSLQKSNDFIKLNKEIESSSKSVQKHLQTAVKVFDSERAKIMAGGGTDEEKDKKIGKVYDYMLNKLFSPEEVKLFKAMRGKSVFLIE